MKKNPKKSEAFRSENLIVLILLIVFFIITILSYVLLGVYKEDLKVTESKVSEVLTGDSFIMDNGDVIKLLCINAPKQGEPGYIESKNLLESTLNNVTLTLEPDLEDKDSDGRLLRYAWITNSSGDFFINKIIYDKGLVKFEELKPNIKRCNELKD